MLKIQDLPLAGYHRVAHERVGNVRTAVASVLRLARVLGIPTSEAALRLAREKLARGNGSGTPSSNPGVPV